MPRQKKKDKFAELRRQIAVRKSFEEKYGENSDSKSGKESKADRKVDEEPPRKKRKYTKRKKAEKEKPLVVYVVKKEHYENVHDGEKTFCIEGIYTTMKEANKFAVTLWNDECDKGNEIKLEEIDDNCCFYEEQEGDRSYGAVTFTISVEQYDVKTSAE